MSEQDIPAGARWGQEIGSHLEKADFGIICLTEQNLDAPWILFEAGALAKSLGTARVCPYLFGIQPSDVKEPLSQFQAKRANEAETLDLIRELNQTLRVKSPDLALSDSEIPSIFARWWTDLEKEFKNAPKSQTETARRRDPQELLEEVLELTRQINRRTSLGTSSFYGRRSPLDQFRARLRAMDPRLGDALFRADKMSLHNKTDGADLSIRIPDAERQSRELLLSESDLLNQIAIECFGPSSTFIVV